MPIDVRIVSEDVRDGADGAKLREAIEAELDAFDSFFTRPVSDGGAGNQDSLLPMERALLRTYLTARLSGRMTSPPAGS